MNDAETKAPLPDTDITVYYGEKTTGASTNDDGHTMLSEIQNVSSRQNVGGIYFNEENRSIDNWTMPGLFSYFNYRIEF